jgi:DNA-binding NtrC family response regulator
VPALSAGALSGRHVLVFALFRAVSMKVRPRKTDAVRRAPDLVAAGSTAAGDGLQRSDIVARAEALLARACASRGQAAKPLDPEAATLIAALPWNNGVAALTTFVEHLADHAPGSTIAVDDVTGAIAADGGVPLAPLLPLREATRRFERRYVAAALERHGGHIGRAAQALGLQRPNLYRKLRALGLTRG